jgi:hypothetical protein
MCTNALSKLTFQPHDSTYQITAINTESSINDRLAYHEHTEALAVGLPTPTCHNDHENRPISVQVETGHQMIVKYICA